MSDMRPMMDGLGAGRSGLRRLAKRWLPRLVQGGLRLMEEAIRQRLYRPSHLALCARSARISGDSRGTSIPPRDTALRDILDWLCRAQDVTRAGGVAGWYALKDGWSPAYPETTGYIIVTFLEAARRFGGCAYGDRARRMAEWELSVQLEDGAWQAGFATDARRPAVFNTGQVIQGLVAAYGVFGDPEFARAAERGAAWLVQEQDGDGAWRRHTYNGTPHTYYSRLAWALAELADRAGNPRIRQAAIRNLEWTVHQQTDDAWFAHCSFSPDEPPLSHTLAYAVEGLVEAGVILCDERSFVAGQRTAEALLLRFERHRRLAGTYGPGWKGDNSFSCVTGCAQMSRVWARFFELTGDIRFLNAALKMNDYLLSLVNWRTGNPALQAAVPGSDPIWGPYMRFRLPSWAAKFTVDALLQETRSLAILSGGADPGTRAQLASPDRLEGTGGAPGSDSRPARRTEEGVPENARTSIAPVGRDPGR